MTIADPIKHFLHRFSYDPLRIRRVVTGAKYLAIELLNGDIGVCGTLMQDFPTDYTFNKQPNPDESRDRILLNAWFNAVINNGQSYESTGDIFDSLEKVRNEKVVMIGYFGPLIQKFREAGIPLDVFDLFPQPDALPMEQQQAYLAKADTVILTSTSLANSTFETIIQQVSDHTKTYLLGPTSMMHQDMFQFRSIAGIFGMIFPQNQEKILNLIAAGAGTPEFGKLGQKVIYLP